MLKPNNDPKDLQRLIEQSESELLKLHNETKNNPTRDRLVDLEERIGHENLKLIAAKEALNDKVVE